MRLKIEPHEDGALYLVDVDTDEIVARMEGDMLDEGVAELAQEIADCVNAFHEEDE